MPHRFSQRSELRAALRVVRGYIIFAALWIFLSDRLLLLLAPELHAYSTLQLSGRLAQVLRHLIANALKFTPPAGQIAISTFKEADRAIIEISDTGIGIPPEVMSRIFQPFEQADRSTTRQFGGVGLGLYLAKSIVELHGGALSATSRGMNQGSTFQLSLPAASDTEPPCPTLPEPATACEGMAVLLVEDNIDTLRVLGRLLARLGCVVHAGPVGRRCQKYRQNTQCGSHRQRHRPAR